MSQPTPDALPARSEPIPFRFEGSGAGYFRIWAVNGALSILTLGLYSPWAKVRRLRYFWGNTTLDGSSFDYLARPIAILKGRLLAFSFFAVAGLASTVFPPSQILFTLATLGLMPWAVVRSLAFRARNTAFRGVRFDFRGQYGEAFAAYVLLPVMVPLTLGALGPHLLYRQKQLVVDRSAYGRTPFRLGIGSRAFYGLVVRISGLAVVAVATAGLASLVEPRLAVATLPPWLLFLAAQWSARSSNLVFGNVRLGDHQLRSRQRAGELVALYLTNTLGILATLGLFIPWARVRSARYRLSRLTIEPAGDLDSFVAAELEEVESLGSELGELLDLDFGL